MSYRFIPIVRRSGRVNSLLPLLLTIGILGAPRSASAQIAATNTLISATLARSTPPGGLVVVDINLTRLGPGPAFGGFDFLIEFDNQALILVSATQGALLDSAGWEYFSYQSEGVAPGTVAIRLIVVADIAGNGEQPSSYLAGQSGHLARIQFLASTDPIYDCQFLPLRFYWNDCSDNAVSSVAVTRYTLSTMSATSMTGLPSRGRPICLQPMGCRTIASPE